MIDYIALDAVGGPTKVSTYAKGGNPEVLNYAYMGSYSENPSIAYGMISPELVQLFGDNDERLNLFFKTTGNLEYYLTRVLELLYGTLPLPILSFNTWL